MVMIVDHGIPTFGKPVKCSIEDITVRGIKCVSLEKVALFDHLGCFKVGIEKDEIWYDLPQDLFQTKDDANAYLTQHHLLIK